MTPGVSSPFASVTVAPSPTREPGATSQRNSGSAASDGWPKPSHTSTTRAVTCSSCPARLICTCRASQLDTGNTEALAWSQNVAPARAAAPTSAASIRSRLSANPRGTGARRLFPPCVTSSASNACPPQLAMSVASSARSIAASARAQTPAAHLRPREPFGVHKQCSQSGARQQRCRHCARGAGADDERIVVQ